MTKQTVVDIGKSSTQYFLTLLFAMVGTYIGVKVSLAEMRKDNERQDSQISEIKHNCEIYEQSLWEIQGDCQFIKGHLGLTTTRGARQ